MTYTPLEPLSQHPEQPLEATFAGYTVVRWLGSGAMGEVYLAKHPRLPRRDALKILRTDVSADEDYRQRFIREADLAATPWHPNIVRVNDRGEVDGQLWIAMDFVDGTDAAQLMRDRYPVGMPPDQVATIITAIASALDYAHQHGLLHRDIKPANILVANTEGDEQRILLGDFGIARSIADISGLTATNMTIGTLPYAAPEQLMDEPIDGRADQYALAATAYHLLTGSPLFPQSNPAVVIGSHLTTPHPHWQTPAQNLPPWTRCWRPHWRRTPPIGSPGARISLAYSHRKPSHAAKRLLRRPPCRHPCTPRQNSQTIPPPTPAPRQGQPSAPPTHRHSDRRSPLGKTASRRPDRALETTSRRCRSPWCSQSSRSSPFCPRSG